jgi:hypothetical protein
MATQSPSLVGPSKVRCVILTTVPTEILVKVIAQVPLKSYLDLVHTSKVFGNFIKLNASRICNEAIRSRFRLEAKVLGSELNSGWLVPTHDKVGREEKMFCETFLRKKEKKKDIFLPRSAMRRCFFFQSNGRNTTRDDAWPKSHLSRSIIPSFSREGHSDDIP